MALRALALLLLASGLARGTSVTGTTGTTSTTSTTSTASPPANSTRERLAAAATGEPPLRNHIRRLNPDGSYTVGYEAGDGSFKIESRDASGNVKGTFGYVDPSGEIKRVTYSSRNTTTPLPVPVAATAPPAPARRTVIQPIPRRAPGDAPVRRQLPDNPRMLLLRQSSGDDAADVYGAHRVVSARPLFTTTTPPRPATRELPAPAPTQDERAYEPPPGLGHYEDARQHLQFRSGEYLRDHPGAAVPIGNQRVLVEYAPPPPPPRAVYYAPPPLHLVPVPPEDDMAAIAAPVSTRDLRRLLHALLARQARLHALLEELAAARAPPPPPPPRYHYEQAAAASDAREYLPGAVRESLLLRMLMLALSPDYLAPLAPPAPPAYRPLPSPKRVRNVQVLGEEGPR